jgi:hypothetical protein
MIREPSAHSMTVETPDPETERENLAQKVFLLERWQAEAVKIISKLEGERDTLQHNLDALLVAGFNTPPGECTNCAELRNSLKEVEAGLSSSGVRVMSLERQVSRLQAENAGLTHSRDVMSEEWDKSIRLQEHRFTAMKAIATAAVDAI